MLREFKTLPVGRVNDEYDCIRVLIVTSPIWSKASLTAEVPDLKLETLVVHGFHVETNSGHGCDDFAEVQFVQDGSLTGVVEADDNHAHLLLTSNTAEDFREDETHFL